MELQNPILIQKPRHVVHGCYQAFCALLRGGLESAFHLVFAPFSVLQTESLMGEDVQSKALGNLFGHILIGVHWLVKGSGIAVVQIVRGILNTPRAMHSALTEVQEEEEAIDEITVMLDTLLSYGGAFMIFKEVEGAKGSDQFISTTLNLQFGFVKFPSMGFEAFALPVERATAPFMGPSRNVADQIQKGTVALIALAFGGLMTIISTPHMCYLFGSKRKDVPFCRAFEDKPKLSACLSGFFCGIALLCGGDLIGVGQVLGGILSIPRGILELAFPRLSRIGIIMSFFQGLRENHNQNSADAFVKQIIQWGGVFPKLAQRLRMDKAIVTSETLRLACAKVMDQCKAKSDFEIKEKLHKELLLRRQDIEVVKTLGTGSVAQVAHVRVFRDGQAADLVMKMTWPEDEMRFLQDFDMFESIQGGFACNRSDELALFVRTVLSKRAEILREFDLTYEFRNTMKGRSLVEKLLPSIKATYTATPLTRDLLRKSVLEKGFSFGDVQGMSRTELTEHLDEPDLKKSNPPDFNIRVPNCVTHGRHILEMEYIPGASLETFIPTVGRVIAFLAEGKSQESKDAFDAYLFGFVPLLGCMLLHEGFGHADPHVGNLLFDHGTKTLSIIDWGACVHLDSEQRLGLKSVVEDIALGHSARCIRLPAGSELSAIAQSLGRQFEAAEKDFAGRSLGVDLWRHILCPNMYDVPQNLDLDELKKTLSCAHVVLCMEAMILTSRLVREADSKLPLRFSVSLLSLWDTFLELPSQNDEGEYSKDMSQANQIELEASVAHLYRAVSSVGWAHEFTDQSFGRSLTVAKSPHSSQEREDFRGTRTRHAPSSL